MVNPNDITLSGNREAMLLLFSVSLSPKATHSGEAFPFFFISDFPEP